MPGRAASDVRPLAPRERWILAAVLAAVLVLRLASVLLSHAPVRSDASGYDAAARRLVATGSYAFPVGGGLWADDRVREDSLAAFERAPANAWSMPGYAFAVAGVYRVFGTGPDRVTPVLALQAVLSVGTLALCFWIARALLGLRAAWIALAFNAIHPPGTWAAGYLLTETLFTLLLALQVTLMVRVLRTQGLLDWILLGVATAAAGYVRPVALPLPAGLAAFAAIRALRAPQRAGVPVVAARFGACALTVALLIAPWALRNQRLYAAFLPTTSAAALPPLQGELFVRGIYAPETFAQYADLSPDGGNDHRFAMRMAAQMRARFGPASWSDRLRYWRIRARMLALTVVTPFKFPETMAAEILWAAALQVMLIALALAGAWRRRRSAAVLLTLAGVPLYFVLLHGVVANLWPRYIYPAMPLVLILAAGALTPSGERRPASRPATAKPRRR